MIRFHDRWKVIIKKHFSTFSKIKLQFQKTDLYFSSCKIKFRVKIGYSKNNTNTFTIATASTAQSKRNGNSKKKKKRSKKKKRIFSRKSFLTTFQLVRVFPRQRLEPGNARCGYKKTAICEAGENGVTRLSRLRPLILETITRRVIREEEEEKKKKKKKEIVSRQVTFSRHRGKNDLIQ